MKQFLICLAIFAVLGTLVFLGVRSLFNPADKDFQTIAGQLTDVAAAQARAIEAQSRAAEELARLNAQLTQEQINSQKADTALKYAAIIGIVILVIIAAIAATLAIGTYKTWRASQPAAAAPSPAPPAPAAQPAAGGQP